MIRPIPSFVRLFVGLSAALLLTGSSSVLAVGTAVVDLAGATFGRGINVHLNSGPTVLPAAAIYDYTLSGKVHGTGLLGTVLPNGTDLSALLERLQAGSSSVLSGSQLNPGGSLPFSIVDRTFSGSFPITPGVTASGTVRIVGRVTTTGQIRFHVVNADFNIPGFPNLGTVVFEPGAKLVVGVRPLIEFKSAAETVRENVGTLFVRVRRKLNTDTSVTVHYSSAPATATANDFDAVSGDLTFAPGEVVKIFPVTIKNRPGVQGSRLFRLRLSPPIGGVLGLNQKDVVTIIDAR